MKAILCATDFSACSDNAIIYATQLAKEFSARLILLHVYDQTEINHGDSPATLTEINVVVQNSIETKIATLKKSILNFSGGIDISTTQRMGKIENEIISAADKEQVDLIVIGNKGVKFVNNVLKGLIHEAKCPVLSIPDNVTYRKIQKIVYATNLDKENVMAAQELILIAEKFNAEILFLYVDLNQSNVRDDKQIVMSRDIRHNIPYNNKSGYIVKSKSVEEGIDLFLGQYEADMLVMFTRQLHGDLKSISEKVSLNVGLPLMVLTVPDRII